MLNKGRQVKDLIGCGGVSFLKLTCEVSQNLVKLTVYSIGFEKPLMSDVSI